MESGTQRVCYLILRRSNTRSWGPAEEVLRCYWSRAKSVDRTDRNGEGPKCIHWRGRYWLIADTWSGQGVWSSDDCMHWKPQDGVLIGNHGDAVIHGDRAWWFYFGGQRGRNPNINWAVIQPAKPATSSSAGTREGTAINVVEAKVVDGQLMYTDPEQPLYIDLGNVRELEK